MLALLAATSLVLGLAAVIGGGCLLAACCLPARFSLAATAFFLAPFCSDSDFFTVATGAALAALDDDALPRLGREKRDFFNVDSLLGSVVAPGAAALTFPEAAAIVAAVLVLMFSSACRLLPYDEEDEDGGGGAAMLCLVALSSVHCVLNDVAMALASTELDDLAFTSRPPRPAPILLLIDDEVNFVLLILA